MRTDRATDTLWLQPASHPCCGAPIEFPTSKDITAVSNLPLANVGCTGTSGGGNVTHPAISVSPLQRLELWGLSANPRQRPLRFLRSWRARDFQPDDEVAPEGVRNLSQRLCGGRVLAALKS